MDLNRVLQFSDFAELQGDFKQVFPHLSKDNPNFPNGAEHRKQWEIVMAAKAFHAAAGQSPVDDLPLPHVPKVLGIAAGHEETIFYLTNYAEVHATDLYANPGIWRREAPPAMLYNPAECVPEGYPWNPERLIVQHMDAANLRYPDNYFDFIFSSNSIDNFGDLATVEKAMQEAGRVLKPGGVCSITTEYRFSGPENKIGFPGAIIFDENMLDLHVIAPSGLELLEPIKYPGLLPNESHTLNLVEVVKRNHGGQSPEYPHYVLRHDGFIYTSISLVLSKTNA